MAGRVSLRAVLPLLLMLSALCRTTGAAPSWGDPFITADTTDKYIKEFDDSNAVMTIYEDVPIGHKIGVLNITAQPVDTVTVTQTSTEDVLLSFNGTNTEQNVLIMSVLDYEKTKSINIGVQLNGGSTNYITIQVADVNDNTPIFDQNQGSQISLDVVENKLNDSLLTLTATDSDVGATATLTYSLDTAGQDEYFELKPVTGADGNPACQLQLLMELDYETRPLYRLTITVTDTPDDRGKTLNSSVTVFINVEDVGDTAPRWTRPPMAYSMDEGAAQGTELFTVDAIDGDTNVNNNISFSIESQDPEGIAEIIDKKTGKVTLTKKLDREDPDLSDGFITIVVQAREILTSDPDQPCSNITCVTGTALITVNDLDDNPPLLQETEFNVNWTEGTPGSLGLSISVTDMDSTPTNSRITMTLEDVPKEGVFEITSPSGAGELITDIRVIDPSYLDYEDESLRTITFKVLATGSNPTDTTNATVTINLKDKNDNSPNFTNSKYTVDIKETEPSGFSVVNVSATDVDSSPEFGTPSIRYTISGGGRWRDSIAVDEKTGEITLAIVSAFDSEDEADEPIAYTIRATDMEGGGEGRATTADLTINVVDVDDTPPQLTDMSDTEVMEEDPTAEIKTNIIASDADKTSKLVFSIDWDNSTAEKDGDVVDQGDYDYTSLFQITTTTKDEDKTKALLSVKGKGPDREKIDTITLRIMVTDSNTEFGDSSDNGDITVKILDKNDNDPFFVNVDETTRFNVTENMPMTSTINQAILANDLDEKNTISYSLTETVPGSGDTDLVTIDSNSGQLSVKGSIDRETQTTINVNVTATDSDVSPRSKSMEISIEVLDQNDNGPKWVEVPSSLKNLTVEENKESASVYTLKASDIDKPDTDYSNITYSLSEDAKKNFTVDPETGELTVKKVLDREELADQNYVMTIQVFAGDACDINGNCAHKTEGLLQVQVLDVNDCPPVFPPQDDDFLAEPMETISKDNQLATVRATDADEEGTDATKLTYTLLEVKPIRTGCKGNVDLFKVETDVGNNQAIIKANQDLQGCWGDYNITLSATDGESPNNNGTGVYQVRILDKNDPPSVDSSNNNFELPEDTYMDTAIPVPVPGGSTLKVNGSDPDDPDTDNAHLTYRLLPGSTPDDANDIFYVDSTSGEVMLRNKLDRESSTGYTYILVVEARDQGEDPLADTVSINITISDVDEFAPEFLDRYNNATHFTEEYAAEQDVKDITSLATDADDTDIIYYFLVGGAKDVFELVDSTAKKPQLKNMKKLDREKIASYPLILQTTRENKQPPDVDVFDPSDPSQLSLTVIVDDINDVTPSFGNRRFMGGIAADDQQTTILRLESDDPDLNDETTYSITSDFTTSDHSIANISQPFVLDEADTAQLKLNFDVSKGMDGYFDFEVTAEDTGKHKNKTNVRVFIIIEDDRVQFVFANPYIEVQAAQDDIANALTAAFSVDTNKYVANIERLFECPDNPQQCTNVITHFIDDIKVVPVLADVIINLQFEDGVTDTLIRSLGELKLNLTKIGDTTVVPPDDNETVYQMLLIAVASVMGGILALTCITSCIHTHKLQRQVKALSINAFGSRESGMQHAGLMVPGSNQNANQGANPLFTMDDKKPMDAESVSSGDSVLIGVEDAPEFSSSARPDPRRPAPSAPLHTNPAYQPDPDDRDDLADRAAPALFDENSHHHMPTFDPDDDEDIGGASPFGGGGGGVSQNPLFGGGGGGSSQNPLFGAEMAGDGDLGGPAGQF